MGPGLKVAIKEALKHLSLVCGERKKALIMVAAQIVPAYLA